MGYESIAHEAEGGMGYWFRGYEGKRNNIIVLVKSNVLVKKYRDLNTFRKLKLDINPFLPPKHYKYGGRFLLLVGYNIEPTSSSTNQNAALMIDH